MQIISYFQINLWPFIIEGSNGYTMFKDRRCGAWSLPRLTAVGKQNSKCVFTRSDVTCPGGTCVASLSGRIVGLVILSITKKIILSGMDIDFISHCVSDN